MELEKVKPGHKRCPACNGVVKGPRTKVCHCGHVFNVKTKVKAKPAVTKTQAPAAVLSFPDPFTRSNVALAVGPVDLGTDNSGNPIKPIRRIVAAGIFNRPNNDKKAMRFISKIGPVPAGTADNIVAYAI